MDRECTSTSLLNALIPSDRDSSSPECFSPLAAPHIRLKNPEDLPGRDRVGIVALTGRTEAAREERLAEDVTGGIASDVRLMLDGRGEAAVIVLTEEVSEGLRDRFCMYWLLYA